MKTGVRMIILSSLNLGDTVIKDHQAAMSQIDTTDSAQVNATIVSTVTGSSYIELGNQNLLLDFTNLFCSKYLGVSQSLNESVTRPSYRGNRELF